MGMSRSNRRHLRKLSDRFEKLKDAFRESELDLTCVKENDFTIRLGKHAKISVGSSGNGHGGDDETNADDEAKIQQILRMRDVLVRLGQYYDETNGEAGLKLEYQQWVPITASFLGMAKLILGEEGVAKYRTRLNKEFRYSLYKTKLQMKFGRRGGKTFSLAIIHAIILVTQPNAVHVMLNLDSKLALQNRFKVALILGWILEDRKQQVGNAHITSNSQDLLEVEGMDGTSNSITFTPDPARTNIRGLGMMNAVISIDEVDFIKEDKQEEVWEKIAPILSMNTLCLMATSQGYSKTFISRMVETAVEAGSNRMVWCRISTQPGLVSVQISDEYAKNADEEEEKNKRSSMFSKLTVKTPWYNPIVQSLSSSSITKTTVTGTTTTTAINHHQPSTTDLFRLDKDRGMSTAECIFFLMLPKHQSVAQTLEVKATMSETGWKREMLNEQSEYNPAMYPAFDPEHIKRLFDQERGIYPMMEPSHINFIKPEALFVAYDPSGGGNGSDAVILSALYYPPVESHLWEHATTGKMTQHDALDRHLPPPPSHQKHGPPLVSGFGTNGGPASGGGGNSTNSLHAYFTAMSMRHTMVVRLYFILETWVSSMFHHNHIKFMHKRG